MDHEKVDLNTLVQVDEAEKLFFNLSFMARSKINPKYVYVNSDEVNDIHFNNMKGLGYHTMNILKGNRIVNVYKLTNKRSRKYKYNNIFDINLWVSPSKVKSLMREPWSFLINEVDSLEKYRLPPNQFQQYLFDSGHEFEEYVVNKIKEKHIINEIEERPSPFKSKCIQETINLMKQGVNIIYQGMLIDGEYNIFGAPDFLIRIDYLPKVFKEFDLGNDEYYQEKSKLGHSYYVVVDIKFKNLKVNSNGALGWNKENYANFCQVYMYQMMLDKIQGEPPFEPLGFLLGKRVKEHTDIFSGLDNLGLILYDEKNTKKLKSHIIASVNEIKEVRMSDHYFTLDNYYEPNPNISDEYNELRNKTLKLKKKRPNIKLETNQDIYLDVFKKYLSNDYEYIIVDFEGLNSDFINDYDIIMESEKSRNVIFLIGYIYQDKYHSIMTKDITDPREQQMWDEFTEKITEIEEITKKPVKCLAYGNYEEMSYNNAKNQFNLRDIDWIDIHTLIKKNQLIVSDQGLSIKTLVNGLVDSHSDFFPNNYEELNIQDGMDASFIAIQYYNKTLKRHEKAKFIRDILTYNKLDCKILEGLYMLLKHKVDYNNMDI